MVKYQFILTLDYELFGNGSGCIEKCVIEPAERLISILDSYGVKCTFFVDALEFKSISEIPNQEVPKSMARLEQQLSEIAASGHQLQLHLHTQWLNAEYKSSAWVLQNDSWRIGDLDASTVDTAVKNGLAYIKKFTKKPITVFRAGGWAIQPSYLVLESLRKRGIIIDSTVAPGAVNLATGDWYDFSQCPRKPFWRVAENVCSEDPFGESMEVPITTANIGVISHIKSLIEHKSRPQFPTGCEGSYEGPNSRVQDYVGKIGKLLRLGHVMLDFSTFPAWALIEITECYMQRFDDTEDVIPIVAIGHNKNFTDRSADNLKEYLDWVSNSPDIAFSTYDSWRHESVST